MTAEKGWSPAAVAEECASLSSTLQNGSDFSGFPVDRCRRLEHAQAVNCLFTEASFRGVWLAETLFQRCDFQRADFRGVSDHGNRFVRCNFDRAKFNSATIGFDGTVFDDCEFTNADFRGSGFVRPRFRNCVFENCKLDGIDFEAASFENCRFVGPLRNVWFRGDYSVPELRRRFGGREDPRTLLVDFSKASLDGVGFANGLDLSAVVLGDDGDQYFFDAWPERLRRLAGGVKDMPRSERPEIEIFLRAFAPVGDQTHMIITRSDLVRLFGPNVGARLLLLLQTASDQDA